MEVGGYHRSRRLENLEDLQAVLAWRDDKGGAILWFGDPHPKYPELAVRISGEFADIHYFPEDGHPGFRCLGGNGLPEGGRTTLVYEGSDPGSGRRYSQSILWFLSLLSG